MEDVVGIMLHHWSMNTPVSASLVITVVGGAKNFKLDGKKKEVFNRGLVNVSMSLCSEMSFNSKTERFKPILPTVLHVSDVLSKVGSQQLTTLLSHLGSNVSLFVGCANDACVDHHFRL